MSKKSLIDYAETLSDSLDGLIHLQSDTPEPSATFKTEEQNPISRARVFNLHGKAQLTSTSTQFHNCPVMVHGAGTGDLEGKNYVQPMNVQGN